MARKMVCVVACVAFLAASAALAGEVDLKAAAKAAGEKGVQAIVSLKATTDVTYNMGGKEQKQQTVRTALATVLDNTGLIVVSVDTVDPYPRYRKAGEAKGEEAGEKQPGRAISAKPVLALMMPDGTDASLVIVRETPDLMFLRPEKQQKLPCLIVPEKAPELSLPDQVLVVSALDTEAGIEPRVSVERVEAIVKKPSLMYVIHTPVWSLGGTLPAFDANGELVGIIASAGIQGPGKKSGPAVVMAWGNPGGMSNGLRATVVIPIADVMKASVPVE